MRRAVVDVGSGSVVALVAEPDGSGGWREIAGTSVTTALGRETKQTGLLGEPGMAATLAALRDAAALARAHGADLRAAGTMALRTAANAEEFRARAAAQGTPVEVLSAEREAELGFRAVVDDPVFSAADALTIVDPGGLSTEITAAYREGGEWRVRHQRSHAIGTLQLRGGLLATETPDVGEILTAAAWVDDTLGVHVAPGDVGTVVVLGAPGTDLVSVRDGLAEWTPERIHGVWLDYEDVGRAVGRFSRMTDAEREVVPGVAAGRGPTIHCGCLILERVLNALAAPGCRVSTHGWRHALLAEP